MTSDFRVGHWLVAPSLNIVSLNGTSLRVGPEGQTCDRQTPHKEALVAFKVGDHRSNAGATQAQLIEPVAQSWCELLSRLRCSLCRCFGRILSLCANGLRFPLAVDPLQESPRAYVLIENNTTCLKPCSFQFDPPIMSTAGGRIIASKSGRNRHVREVPDNTYPSICRCVPHMRSVRCSTFE